MKKTEIQRLSFELRLSGIHGNFERRCAAAAVEGMTHEEFLVHLLEDERQYRKNRTAKMLETKAKFRRDALLEQWDLSIDRGISKTKIRELSTFGFWNDKKNLMIFGETGSGKTQLAMALGRIACQMQLTILFLPVNQFFEEATANRACGKFLSWMKNLKKHDVVILDDFALRRYTHEEAVMLVDFLEDRYRRKIHIITSQVNPDGWKTLFEDPVIADALIDRMKNPCEKIKLTGGSYRERIS